MKTFASLCLAALVLGALAAPDPAAEAKQAIEKINDAYNHGDAAAVSAFHIEHFTYFRGNGQPLLVGLTREGFARATGAGLRFQRHWRDLEVTVHGTTAVYVGYLDGQVTLPDGTGLRGPWRASGVLVEQDGRWQRAHAHESRAASP